MTDLPEGVRVWLQARNQPLQILEDEVLQEGAPEYHHNGSIVQNDQVFHFCSQRNLNCQMSVCMVLKEPVIL